MGEIILIVVLVAALAFARRAYKNQGKEDIYPDIREKDDQLEYPINLYHESNSYVLPPTTRYYLKGTKVRCRASTMVQGDQYRYQREYHAFIKNSVLARSVSVTSLDYDDFCAKCDAQFKQWADEVKAQELDKKEEK